MLLFLKFYDLIFELDYPLLFDFQNTNFFIVLQVHILQLFPCLFYFFLNLLFHAYPFLVLSLLFVALISEFPMLLFEFGLFFEELLNNYCSFKLEFMLFALYLLNLFLLLLLYLPQPVLKDIHCLFRFFLRLGIDVLRLFELSRKFSLQPGDFLLFSFLKIFELSLVQ